MKRGSHVLLVLVTAAGSATANGPFYVEAVLVAGTAPSVPIVSCVETGPDSGIWDITVTLTGATPPVAGGKAELAVLVENLMPGSGTGDAIGSIVIDAKDAAPHDGVVDLQVELALGNDLAALVANIDSVRLASSVFDTNLHVAEASEVIGNINEIFVNSIPNMTIAGDVGSVFVHWNQGGVFAGTPNSIGDLTITGDVTGTIYVGHGTADRIAVTGDVGTPAAPAAVYVRSHVTANFGAAVGAFSCQNLHAIMQIGAASAAEVPRIDRLFIGGDQYGFLYIPIAAYLETPALEIAGDVAGEIIVGSAATLTSDDRAVRVSGDVLAGGAVIVNRWIDTVPTGHPKTIVGIGGTVWGRLALGASRNGGNAQYPGFSSIGGDLTQDLPGGIGATGVLDLHGPVSSGTVVNIDGGFAGQLRVADGIAIAGQIIINSDASGSDLFTGSAVLDFDSSPVALTPIPNYANLSADLGGGAIGVVPFNLHAPDCEPPSGSLITVHTGLNGVQPPASVRIRHYGPVRLASTGSQLLVERADFTAPPDWETVSTEYQFAISSENPRDLIVTGDFGPDYRYRIRPNGQVLCAGNSILDAGSFAVFDYTYNLRVRTPLDRNMNGMMEFGDIELQVADPIDINGDTAADVLDLAEVIQAVANP